MGTNEQSTVRCLCQEKQGVEVAGQIKEVLDGLIVKRNEE